MGRRATASSGDDGGMDMMSCLIGCLILILIGILLIIMVSQALIIVANPDTQQVQYIQLSKVDAIKEDKAFPKGNRDKEPTYLDVHRDYLVIIPGDKKVMMRDLEIPNSDFLKTVQYVKKYRDTRYFVLLIRPNAGEQARRLRRRLLEKELIQVGTELVRTEAKVDYNEEASATLQRQQELEDAQEAQGDGAPSSAPAPARPAGIPEGSSPFPVETTDGDG